MLSLDAYRLITRKLSGEATEEELAALDELIAVNPEVAAHFSWMQSWWNHTPAGPDESPARPYKKLKTRIAGQAPEKKDPSLHGHPLYQFRSAIVRVFSQLPLTVRPVQVWHGNGGNLFTNLHIMIRQYLNSSWRSILRNKSYSILNIMGLAVGITCAGLIMLWVEDEKSFDSHFNKKDYIYRVMENQVSDGKIQTNGSTPGPMAAAVKAEIPGIRQAGRLSWAMDELLQYGDKSIKEKGGYVDPSVLSILGTRLTSGNLPGAFKNLQSVLISESLAARLFGNTNALGKVINMNMHQGYSVDGPFMVTGVYPDFPQNSSYHFQWLSPYAVWENYNDWLKPWNNNLTETLVELEPTARVEEVNSRLNHFLSAKIEGNSTSCFLYGMNDWRMNNRFENGRMVEGNGKYVRLFFLVSWIILAIACINYMNLATARSEQRAREVGVRKVMGAAKGSLVVRFFAEAWLTSTAAVLLAVGILYLVLPAYNSLLEKQLSLHLSDPAHITWLLGVVVITGIIAGSYPAFYLSAFNPISVLKGAKVKSSAGALFARKGLVVTQFAVSVMLIFCTAIVYRQVLHISHRDTGYQKNNVVYIDAGGEIKYHFAALKNKLLQTGAVENAALNMFSALQINSYNSNYSWSGKDTRSSPTVYSNSVSPGFIETMQMKMVSGRDFYENAAVDSNSVIINESMARLMGAAGTPGNEIMTARQHLKIVGVVKDFIYNDVYGTAGPLILLCAPNRANLLTLRLKGGVDQREALAKITAVISEINPGEPVTISFLDKAYNEFFSIEMLTGRLAALFAGLAIFISCLGLFGLAGFTAERRRREMGIRKVLGASVYRITGLLTGDFLQLIALACIIALPVAAWLMHNWLQNYAYKTSIDWWMFAVTAIVAIMIAMATVSFQAIKAAITNPIKSLSAE